MLLRTVARQIPQISMISLNQIQRHQFGIVGSIKSTVTGGSVYRGIFILASIQMAATYLTSYMIDRGITMSPTDLMENSYLKQKQQFQLAGIIKPGSFSLKRGCLECKFVLTDFSNEVEVFYRGETKFEFKEGEVMVLTAYVPDISNRNKVIGIDYITKHSMDTTNWADRIEAPRKNFGVKPNLGTIS